MKYLVLVSHGEFAAGLKTSLMMLAGQRDDVIASGLPDGKTADEFAEIFKESVKDIHEDDEIVLLADIVGGSPLTTALNVLAEKGLMEKTTTIGGMNLPLALTSVLMKDTLQGDSFVQAVLSEATTAMYPLMEPALESLANQIYATQFKEEEKCQFHLLELMIV